MELAVSHVPDDAVRVREIAAAVQDSGLTYLGLADSPVLHGGVFAAVQWALGQTSSLRIGTFVTNPVLRHASVLAAEFAMLADLYPGRVWAGLGAGDTSVRSVGLPPATPGELAEAVRTIGVRAGAACPILVAVGSERTARALSPHTTGIIIGGGLEPSWVSRIIATAEAATGHRLQRWGFAVSSLLDAGADLQAARSSVLGSVLTISRHGLGSRPAARGVPEHLVPGLLELYSRCELAAHGQVGGPNAALAEQYPAQRDYLLERFALVGTATSVADRIGVLSGRLDEHSQLDALMLTTVVADPVAHINRVGRELLPLVAPIAATG